MRPDERGHAIENLAAAIDRLVLRFDDLVLDRVGLLRAVIDVALHGVPDRIELLFDAVVVGTGQAVLVHDGLLPIEMWNSKRVNQSMQCRSTRHVPLRALQTSMTLRRRCASLRAVRERTDRASGVHLGYVVIPLMCHRCMSVSRGSTWL